MRKAAKTVAMATGITAALAGMEHGVFEILQKNTHSSSLMFASMGPPCDPIAEWNACEPAMSLISSFLSMGVITIVLGMLLGIWSVFFIDRKGSGWITISISILLLLFGGGFFPPLIGIVSGFVANTINKPIAKSDINGFIHFTAILWPWPLVYFLSWAFGQFLIGYFFNDFLKNTMVIFLLVFLAMLVLSIFTAHAQDRKNAVIRN